MCSECNIITIAIMRLLEKYIIFTQYEYGKFTIGYTMLTPTGEILFTIEKSIPIEGDVYSIINKILLNKGEDYPEAGITSIFI